ncbi:cystatin-like isoform X1 [Erythrolamprus reginae]|uniref:cystatin-like isoform X1 n=1 Tax=Erythrolamprus reginae TaxID=121349 RepID=UPI00396CACD9
MAHSQLPCPLFLLCSLLMLPTVLLQGILGGVETVDVTDKGVVEAAAFAVEKYNEGSKNTNYFKELRIVEAKYQVVEGAKYYLRVEIGKTVCEKGDGPLPFSDIQKCELVPADQREKLTCNFQVWSRPWLKEIQLVGSFCS